MENDEKETGEFNTAFEACREANEGADSIAAYDDCVNKAKALRTVTEDQDNRDKINIFIEAMENGRDAFLRKHALLGA